jgi:dienelactone hydrolase
VRVAEMHGAARTIADLDTVRVQERDITIPTTLGAMRARAYEPPSPHRAALLTSGTACVGDRRTAARPLARQLSAGGVTIVTPDIPELSRFEMTPAITDAIERAAGWLAMESGLAPQGPVGLMGISFRRRPVHRRGRPAIARRTPCLRVRARRPRRSPRVCCATSARDRSRTPARELGIQSDRPFVLAPHDYGVAVILLATVDRLVPKAQAAAIARGRQAIPGRLGARHQCRQGRGGARVRRAANSWRARCRSHRRRCCGTSTSAMSFTSDRGCCRTSAAAPPTPALSVSKSPKPSVPVFLLHGTEDNVIPSLESEYLAQDLRGHAPVRLLLSGLISHAETDRPVHLGDVMQLAGFWGDLLAR